MGLFRWWWRFCCKAKKNPPKPPTKQCWLLSKFSRFGTVKTEGFQCAKLVEEEEKEAEEEEEEEEEEERVDTTLVEYDSTKYLYV